MLMYLSYNIPVGNKIIQRIMLYINWRLVFVTKLYSKHMPFVCGQEFRLSFRLILLRAIEP